MSDLPRLLFCCFEVVPGPHAMSRRLTEYLDLVDGQYQTVVLSKKDADRSHIERYHGARLLRVPVGSGDLASQLQSFDRAVRRQLDSEEYAAVHFFDPFGGYALCERRPNFTHKLIYDAFAFPSVDLPSYGARFAQDTRFIASARRKELFCLMNADAVIVGSELTREYTVALGVQREHVSVMRAPVDTSAYFEALVGEPNGAPLRLLHLGSEHEYHDLPLVLEAVALAAATVDVRLAIVGPRSIDLHGSLAAEITAKHLEARVQFKDAVSHDELPTVLAESDVGLLTLRDGPRSRVVGGALPRAAEFLAAGRPLIAADMPITRELIDEATRVLYQPGDARSLADAIVALATDLPRRLAMGRAARDAARAWDAKVAGQQLVALYARLLGERRSSDSATFGSNEDTQSNARRGSEEEHSEVTQLGARPFEGDSGVGDPGTNKVKTDPAIRTAADVPVPGDPIELSVPPSGLQEIQTTGVTEEVEMPPVRAPSFGDLEPILSIPTPLPYPGITAPLSSAGAADPTAPPNVAVAPELTHSPAPSMALIEPAPRPSPRRSDLAASDDAAEVSAEDVMPVGDDDEALGEADAVEGDSPVGPPLSALDPWFAQLVHGYGPPEQNLFNRHTPPTTMPGRDE